MIMLQSKRSSRSEARSSEMNVMNETLLLDVASWENVEEISGLTLAQRKPIDTPRPSSKTASRAAQLAMCALRDEEPFTRCPALCGRGDYAAKHPQRGEPIETFLQATVFLV